MVPQQPRYFLEAPIRVPWITLTLCELEVSQDREELWKRPFLHQEAAEMATQLLGLCGLCSCASEAGSSWQISLPQDEHQITGGYRTALDHLLKSLVKWIGTHIQKLFQVISVCLCRALPATGSCQWCAGTPWHGLQRRQLGSRSVTRLPNLPIKSGGLN